MQNIKLRPQHRNGGGVLPFLLICTLTLLLISARPTSAEFHCQIGEWWNGTCVTCTTCVEVVLRTCQPHKDTICGSFEDIKINLMQVRKRLLQRRIDHVSFNNWLNIVTLFNQLLGPSAAGRRDDGIYGRGRVLGVVGNIVGSGSRDLGGVCLCRPLFDPSAQAAME